MTVSNETLHLGLKATLDETDLDVLGEKYEGKVRDNYTRDGKRYIVVTDRISAFDRVLGTLPYKGQVLNGLAAWWFEHTKDVVPNHMLDVPDPNVMVGVECVPLPVEMVMRAYITGVTSTSIWSHYEAGARESLIGVEREGCSRDAPALVRQLSYDAATTLGHEVRVDSDGVMRPDVCPPLTSRSSEEAWRPEE